MKLPNLCWKVRKKSLASAMPKREKKAKNTINNNKE
jgi:hypothetical protein